MTTDLDRIAEALRQADAAGDVEGARKLASYYRQAAQAAAAAPAANQPGRLGSFASNVGRGALSVIPGTVGGVGYALGSDTLTRAADTIEGDINRMLRVNPEYQDELLMKGGQAVGQAIGMLGTGGAVGAAGKSLALSRGLAQGAAAAKGANLARNVMLGTGIAQGTRGGGQAAEQYGMQGGAAYARALLGGAIEGASERYLFGMGTELAPVKKFLGEAAEKGVGGIVKSAGTEAGEEAVSQIGGNVATSVLAPYGVQTPGVLEGVGESALLGGIAGGTIGGIGALMQPSPTIEGDALVPTEQAPPPVEEPEDDYGVAAFQQEIADIAAQPDPIAPIQQTVTAAAENSVRVNANVLPATAAVIEAGGLAPAPAPRDNFEQPRFSEELIAKMNEIEAGGLAPAPAPAPAPVATVPAARTLLDQAWDTLIEAKDRISKTADPIERRALEKQIAEAKSFIQANVEQGITQEETPVGAPTVEQPAPIAEQPRTREEEIAQMRARLRLNLSAEEREDMEQQLAQAQDEGVLADVFAEERRKAVAREDFLRRQQDLEAERQRLEDEGILGDVFAEERQRATTREQQRQQSPVVEEIIAPEQSIPTVEETVAPQESAARKPRKFAVNPVSDFINEQRIEADLQQRQSDWREKQTERITSKDIITADWEKIRDDIQRGRRGLTVEKALAMVNDAFDKKVIPKQWHDILTARISSTQRPVEETVAPEITPEQVPNVENVIDEPGAAEVGLGMEKPQTREGSYTFEERDTFTETPREKRRDRFVVSSITGTVFDRFFAMAVTPPAFKDQQAAADALNASEYNKTIPLPVGLGQKDGQSFFDSVYEWQPEVVIQPTPSPAPAPAPTVQRDMTKPEQMTPEEALLEARGELFLPEASSGTQTRKALAAITRADPDYVRSEHERKIRLAISGWGNPDESVSIMFRGMPGNQPVSAAAVDAYKITLPEGYVRQGDLYVFQPSDMVEAKPAPPAKPGQRDVTKPEFKPKEQQNPDEYLADFSYDIALARAERDNTGKSLKALKKEGREAYEKRIREQLRQSHVDAIKIASGLDGDSNKDFAKYGMSAPHNPVSKAAVDAYGITLPEGYVRQGDLYVFQPSGAVEAKPEPTPKEPEYISPKEIAERFAAESERNARRPSDTVAEMEAKEAAYKPQVRQSGAELLEEYKAQQKAKPASQTKPAAEVETPVAGVPETGMQRRQQALDAGLDRRTADAVGAFTDIASIMREVRNRTPEQIKKDWMGYLEADLEKFKGSAPRTAPESSLFADGQYVRYERQKDGGFKVVADEATWSPPGEKANPQFKKGKVIREFPNVEALFDYVRGESAQTPAPQAPTPEPAPPAKPGQRDTSKPEQMTPEERGLLGHQEVIDSAKRDYELAKTGQTWGFSGGQSYKTKAAAVKDTKALLDKISTPTESDIKRGASDHYGEVNKAVESKLPVSAAAVDAYQITLPEGYVQDGELYVYRPSGTVEAKPAPPAKPAAQSIADRLRAATSRAEAQEIVDSATHDQLKAAATELNYPPKGTKKEIANRLVASVGSRADAIAIRNAGRPAQPPTPPAKPAAEVGTGVAGVLARGKPRESIVFKKPISTPLGDVIGYSWSSQLVEDVDNMGEPVLRRISNWEEAANNAETGRDIVHRFLIKKPDGTTSEVSLESTFGKMTDSDKKTIKSVVAAAKKLPFMRAELAELQDLQKQAEVDYQRTQKLKPDPTKLELREPDVKWRAEKGDKVAYLDDVFLGFVESGDINAKGELTNKAKFVYDNAWKWRDAKRTVRVTDAQKDRAKSLTRSIKKAEDLLSRENVEAAKVTTGEQQTSLAEAGPPAAGMKPPSAAADQPAPISTRPSLGSTGKQIVSEWRSLQGTKVAPGETVVGWDVNGGGTYAFINDKLVKLKKDDKGFESTYTDATGADWQDVSDALDRGALQVEVRKITGLGNYPKVDAGKTVKVLHQATGKPLQEFLDTPEGAAYEARMQKAMAERGPKEFGSANTVVTKETKDKAAKNIGGTVSIGGMLNPAILKDVITVGTYYLEGGVRSFADFSAKMVEEFGEGVRKYLQPAYEALRKRTDIDTAGMDAEEGVETAPVVEAPKTPPPPALKSEAPKPAPAAATTQEPATVAIANDPVDAQRVARGLEPIMRQTQEAYTFPQMWSDAEAAMRANPERGKTLVKTLNDKPRNISALEDAILLRERVNRVNALDLAMVEFNQAPKGNNEEQRRAMDEAITSLTDLDNALAVAGTEQGRSLNARKMLARQDYTLAKMISTLRAANDGDLSESDIVTITRLQKQIDETQKKRAEVESGQADRIAEAEKIAFEAGRQEVLKDIEERAKADAAKVAEMQKRKAEYLAAKKEAAKTPSKWEEIRAAARARNAELRSNLYSDVVLVKAASMAVNDVIIGATYIAEGVTKFADWVSKMRSEDINLTDDEMQQLFKESKAFDAGEDLPASEAPLKVKKAKAPAIDKVKAIAADEEALDSRTVYNLVVEKMKARVEANPALEKVEMSTDDLTNIISEVTKDIQEFFPDITEREVRDLFSGYGTILEPSKDELAKQMRQLTALGRLNSAIEDAIADLAPLKSGVQRDRATQAIRLQQKKLARELRMMGRDYEAGEGQLRSPLDAMKARVNNQINDLDYEIRKGRKNRRPTPDADPELEKLIELRDELKRLSDFLNAPAGPTFTELVQDEKDKLDKRIGVLEKALESKQFMPKEDRKLYTQELQVKRDKRDELNEQIRKLRKIEADKSRTQEDIDRAAIASVKESIAELDRKIKEKDFARPERRTPTETAEYLALVAKKEALQDTVKEERLKLFGRKGPTDEQRIKQATAAVDKSIERMQKMLTSGNYDVPKRTSKTPETPELAQKRETRDKLRKQLLELRKLKRDALIDPIAKQLKTDKKRIQTRMDKLKKRMETGDFSKPEKRKKATDDELLALQVEEENLKEAWAKMVFERQLASRGPGKRLLDAGQQTINTARAVLTSFDVSAVLRQGGFIVLGNPLRGFRNLGPMFQAFGSDKFAKEEKFRLERRENFKNGAYQQSKLFLADVNKVDQMTQQEEAFMSRWIKKLPKGAKGLFIGSAIQGSQRAYTVFLNRLRMDTFDAMVANLKKGSEPTPQEMSAVANYINIATGRGDLGKFNQAGTMLNTVFFAPRLVASRFQILAGYPYFTASGRTKALVLREYGKFFAGATLVYVIGALAQGDDDEPIETDPRSSDFLKIRFGDTRVDPLSGLIQATVLVSRLVSGEKKQASGKIVPIRGEKVPYGADDSFDVMGNFVRTKFSPIVGSAVNVVTGKNVVGEPTDIGEETKRMLIPMSFTEMKETLEAQGVPEATALIMLQLFGMGVQTYTPGKK